MFSLKQTPQYEGIHCDTNVEYLFILKTGSVLNLKTAENYKLV